VLVDLGGHGLNPVLREIPDHLAKHFLFFVQVHARLDLSGRNGRG
jgi:hypothetical protein